MTRQQLGKISCIALLHSCPQEEVHKLPALPAAPTRPRCRIAWRQQAGSSDLRSAWLFGKVLAQVAQAAQVAGVFSFQLIVTSFSHTSGRFALPSLSSILGSVNVGTDFVRFCRS